MCAACLSFVVAGISCVSVYPGLIAWPRTSVRTMDASINQHLVKWQADIKAGQPFTITPQATKLSRHVPQVLQANTGYLVPLSGYHALNTGNYWLLPSNSLISQAALTRVEMGVSGYLLIPTTSNAAKSWRAEALSEEQDALHVDRPIADRMVQEANSPTKLDIGAGMAGVTMTAVLLILALVLDKIAASLGRLTFRKFRRNWPIFS